MINPFIIKKYAALIIVGMFSSIFLLVGTIYYGVPIGIVCMFAGLLTGVIVANLLLKNPFTTMLEGKGILAINLSSTGIMQTFIVKVNPPYIQGKLNGKLVNDVFNRSTVMQLEPPKPANKPAQFLENGGIKIELDKDELNSARFGFFQYPCLIWNNQLHSVLTKDFLSDKEKGAFAEHGILYLNRKTEELTSHIRDFGRYIVETLKPKDNFFANKWVWLIIVVVLIILAALFAPAIINAIKPMMAGVGTAAGAATKAQSAITPIN